MSWFYAKHGKQEGPLEEDELRSKLSSGELGPDDLVWQEGMGEWKPAGEALPPPAGAVQEGGPDVPPAPPDAGGQPAGAAPPQGGTPLPAAPGAAGGLSVQNQPPPGVPMLVTPPPTSGLAIASMVCGIISLLVCYVWALVGIPAVICGHLALNAINKSVHPVEGRGMAIAGLITGYLAILIQIVVVILFVVVLSGARGTYP